MKINIPDSFLKHALIQGVDSETAVEVYVAKMNKKSTEPSAINLVEAGDFETLTMARNSIRAAWNNHKTDEQKSVHSIYNKADIQSIQVYDSKDYMSKALNELQSLIGDVSFPKYDVKLKKESNRIAVISDLHIPFMSEKAFAAVCNDPAEELWIAGDILDMYGANRHRKNLDYITVREELAKGRAVMEILASKFKRIFILPGGNHDLNAMRRIQDTFPQLACLMMNPVEMICGGLTNIQFLSSVIKDTAPGVSMGTDYELDFMGMRGDALISHFDNFCGQEALLKIDQWIGEWDHVLNLPTSPRIILNGHVHKLFSQFTPKGRLLVCTGCLCKPMMYQFTNHGKYSAPTIGYTALYVDDFGVTDLNKTQLIYIGQ